MEDQKIEVGTVVMLKSGGPRMTVIRVEGDLVEITFFHHHIGDHEHLQRAAFPAACLNVIIGFGAAAQAA